jgi:hypothetical protein
MFSRLKNENALELARTLCVLANAGRVAWSGGDQKQRWFEACMDLLYKAGWQPDLTTEYAIMPYKTGAWNADAAMAMIRHFRISPKDAPSYKAVCLECMGLSIQLELLMTNGEVTAERKQVFTAKLSRDTGQIEQREISPLGVYQNIFARAIPHRKIDFRRFARCVVCEGFFYKPRLSSRACSHKCEDVLMSREHYDRERERRERAVNLRNQGKSLHEIARELGVGLMRARRYVSK